MFALQLGIVIPFLYFVTQFIAAPFFPNYSFLSMEASFLGSDRAIYPAIFNVGTVISGIATLLASIGFFLALQRLEVNRILAWFTFIAIFLTGIGSLWAGFIPLPDPRHGSNPFMFGSLAFPILLAITLWKRSNTQTIKIYLIITNLLFLAMLPITSGLTGLDTKIYQGLLQRIVALIFLPPIGVGAYFLIKCIKPLKAITITDKSIE